MATANRPSRGPASLRAALRLDEPLPRRPYAIVGCGLMALKYLVEAAVIGLVTDRFYRPLDFLNPLLSVRGQYIDPPAPDWLGWALIVWSIPFLCIATTMSVRRSLDAGIGPWMGLWIFVPGLNFVLMLVLCLMPSQPRPAAVTRADEIQAAHSIGSSLLGAAVGATVGLLMLAFSVYVLRDYGAGLFMGTPLLVAAIAAWFFRLGIAYPKRATIDGSGVGAVRHCEFSTGPFVEPITAWEPPRRLAFDVASQPPPMHELSPYRHIHPPHLDGYLRCRRGEFRLVPLSGGRTRLEGSTWYAYEIYPQAYWTLWSDLLIHRIHDRVLRHIKRSSESHVPPSATATSAPRL